MIQINGYYISEEFTLVDWHAGHKFEETKYYLLKFFDNNCSIRASYKSTDIPKSIFKERMNNIDKYIFIDDKTLEITINPQSEWRVTKRFTILSPEILLDENLKEYRFVPTNKLV
jgi:hypothetical protein